MKYYINKTIIIILSFILLSSSFSKKILAEDYYDCVWKYGEDNKLFWYEKNERQGIYGDKKNIWDKIYGIERGREIYDPLTNAWYWLDAVYNGAIATNKEVWMPYIYQDEEPGSTDGKWVRYDSEGKMIKGLYKDANNNIYYYDLITGEMYKGIREVNGINLYFDSITGILQIDNPDDEIFIDSLLMDFNNNRIQEKRFEDNHDKFEKAYRAYINAYDIAEDGTDQMQIYSNIRVPQLENDFSHNFNKMDAAAIQAGLSDEGLYSPYNEAIQYFMNSNLANMNYEEVAKNMAAAMRNSSAHWSYVGPASMRSYGFYYVGNYVYIVITTCG